MSQTVEKLTLVRKNISLFKGESLHAFQRKLSEDGRKIIKQKLNLGVNKASVFVAEIFKDVAVFDVYKYSNGEGASTTQFFASKFTRKASGDFEFTDMVEVQRVVSFQTKPAALPESIAKSAEQPYLEGWDKVQKSIWANVI